MSAIAPSDICLSDNTGIPIPASYLRLFLRYRPLTGVRKIMETARNFNLIYFNMVFWLKPLPIKCSFVQLPSNKFLENWVSRWSLGSAVIFRAVFLRSFLTIRVKVWRFPIKQLSLSSRILLQLGGFSFFLKCCHYFWNSTHCCTK